MNDSETGELKSETNNLDSDERLQVSMLDLMVLTATFAFSFGFFEILASQDGSSYANSTWGIFFRVQYALTTGLTLTGLLLLIRRFIKFRSWFKHPGHVILFYLGVSTVVNLTSAIVTRGDSFVINGDFSLPYLIASVLRAIPELIIIGLSIFACFRFRWWWSLSLITIATSALSGVVAAVFVYFDNSMWFFNVNGYLITFLLGGTILTILASLVADRYAKEKRDWIHYYGIAVYFLMAVILPIVMTILVRFVSMQDLFGA